MVDITIVALCSLTNFLRCYLGNQNYLELEERVFFSINCKIRPRGLAFPIFTVGKIDTTATALHSAYLFKNKTWTLSESRLC